MRREGFLHIVPYQNTVFSVPEEYDVTFAPNDYSGVLRPRRLRGHAELVKFLDEDVGLNPDALRRALEMVEAQKSISVPNVIFTDEEIIRLGLAA